MATNRKTSRWRSDVRHAATMVQELELRCPHCGCAIDSSDQTCASLTSSHVLKAEPGMIAITGQSVGVVVEGARQPGRSPCRFKTRIRRALRFHYRRERSIFGRSERAAAWGSLGRRPDTEDTDSGPSPGRQHGRAAVRTPGCSWRGRDSTYQQRSRTSSGRLRARRRVGVERPGIERGHFDEWHHGRRGTVDQRCFSSQEGQGRWHSARTGRRSGRCDG